MSVLFRECGVINLNGNPQLMFPLLLISVVSFVATKGLDSAVDKGIEQVIGNEVEEGISHLQDGIDFITRHVVSTRFKVDGLVDSMAEQSAMLSSIQTSIGAIGFAATAGCVLSAVNVYQLIKVQKTLTQLNQKVDDGFIDLKLFMNERLENLLEEQQKRRLAEAYHLYLCGLERLKTAFIVNDVINRNNTITHCISEFNNALAIYDSSYTNKHSNLAAKLRRLECCWSIQGSIAEAYLMQEEYEASLYSYKRLQQRIFSETDNFISSIDQETHSFITADLHWIYQNDIKILDEKIKLLEEFKKTKVFQQTALDDTKVTLPEDFFDKNPLPVNQLYLTCLRSDEQAQQVKTDLIKSRYSHAIGECTPLALKCQKYYEMQNLLSEQWQYQQIADLFSKPDFVMLTTAKNVSMTTHITEKKLSNLLVSCAKNKQADERCLLLIESGGFVNFLAGAGNDILLTDQALYSQVTNRLAYQELYSINIDEQKNQILLNNIYKISVRDEQKQLIVNLLNNIRDFLCKTWKIGLQLSRNLKQKTAVIELLHKITKIDHDAIENFEWLVKLNIDSKEERHLYFNILLKNNDLDRLDYFIRQRPQEKGLILRYATYLASLKEVARLNQLQTDISDFPALLEQYLTFLLKTHLNDELIQLAKQYPDNNELIKTVADYFFNQQAGEVLSVLLSAIPDNPDLLNVYFNFLLQTEDVPKFFDLVQRYSQHTDILIAYLGLLVARQDSELLQALLALFPTSAAVKTEFAFLLLKTQQYQAALIHLDEVLTLTTDYRFYEIQLARTEALQQLKQWDAAIIALRFAMQIGVTTELQWREVQLLTQLKQYQEAISCLQVMTESPENIACQVILLSRQESYPAAAQQLENLIGYPCFELQTLCSNVGADKR